MEGKLFFNLNAAYFLARFFISFDFKTKTYENQTLFQYDTTSFFE